MLLLKKELEGFIVALQDFSGRLPLDQKLIALQLRGKLKELNRNYVSGITMELHIADALISALVSPSRKVGKSVNQYAMLPSIIKLDQAIDKELELMRKELEFRMSNSLPCFFAHSESDLEYRLTRLKAVKSLATVVNNSVLV